eukprot:scaffold4182_cov115-Amphora_coffeaeformis.AAC.1
MNRPPRPSSITSANSRPPDLTPRPARPPTTPLPKSFSPSLPTLRPWTPPAHLPLPRWPASLAQQFYTNLSHTIQD